MFELGRYLLHKMFRKMQKNLCHCLHYSWKLIGIDFSKLVTENTLQNFEQLSHWGLWMKMLETWGFQVSIHTLGLCKSECPGGWYLWKITVDNKPIHDTWNLLCFQFARTLMGIFSTYGDSQIALRILNAEKDLKEKIAIPVHCSIIQLMATTLQLIQAMEKESFVKVFIIKYNFCYHFQYMYLLRMQV